VQYIILTVSEVQVMFFSETLIFHTSPGNNSSQIVFLIHKPKYIAPQEVVYTC